MSRVAAWFIVLLLALLVFLVFPNDTGGATAHGLCLSPIDNICVLGGR